MTISELSNTELESWAFEVEGFHLDAPVRAKQHVAEEEDLEYNQLRARVINRDGFGKKCVAVVQVTD